MKKIIAVIFHLLFFKVTLANLYVIVVGHGQQDFTNLCPGDTLRFCGDSLDGGIWGTVEGEVGNINSSLNDNFSVSSDSNFFTCWDHVLIPGDNSYSFSSQIFGWGFLTFNCATDISLDPEVKTSVSIFPNPANTLLQILSESQIKYVKVCDYFGKTIMDHHQDISKEQPIDISSVAPGIYLIEIGTNSQSIFKKLIKE